MGCKSCVRQNNYLHKHKHLNILQKQVTQTLNVIDYFHIYNETKFIEHMENKELLNIEDGKMGKDYEKINKPINLVKLYINVFQFNDTILHYAVYAEKEEVIKYLVKHKANLTIQNKVLIYCLYKE